MEFEYLLDQQQGLQITANGKTGPVNAFLQGLSQPQQEKVLQTVGGSFFEALLNRDPSKTLPSFYSETPDTVPETPTPPPPPAEKSEPVLLTEQYFQKLQKKSIKCKLPEGAMVCGQAITKELDGPFIELPDLVSTPENEAVWSIANLMYNNSQRDASSVYADLYAAPLVTLSKVNNNRQLVEIYFFNQNTSTDTRGKILYGHVYYGFAQEDAADFIQEIQQNPDFLEDFFQRVFPQLDERNSQLPSLKRLPAKGFYLIAEDTVTPDVKQWVAQGNHQNIAGFIRKQPFQTFKNGPYGSGDPELIPKPAPRRIVRESRPAPTRPPAPAPTPVLAPAELQPLPIVLSPAEKQKILDEERKGKAIGPLFERIAATLKNGKPFNEAYSVDGLKPIMNGIISDLLPGIPGISVGVNDVKFNQQGQVEIIVAVKLAGLVSLGNISVTLENEKGSKDKIKLVNHEISEKISKKIQENPEGRAKLNEFLADPNRAFSDYIRNHLAAHDVQTKLVGLQVGNNDLTIHIEPINTRTGIS